MKAVLWCLAVELYFLTFKAYSGNYARITRGGGRNNEFSVLKNADGAFKFKDVRTKEGRGGNSSLDF